MSLFYTKLLTRQAERDNLPDMDNEITHDIPPPRKRVRHLQGMTRKLRAMKVGESFLAKAAQRNNIYTMAKNAHGEAGTIITRQDDNRLDLIRVWRVK